MHYLGITQLMQILCLSEMKFNIKKIVNLKATVCDLLPIFCLSYVQKENNKCA